MFINRDGCEVSPPDTNVVECIGELKVKYVVRLIEVNSWGHKTVIAEEFFDKKPSESQIKWCLSKHKAANFAVLEEIYEIEKEFDLPF